jgi:two-component system, chemotaxis family, response regulator Rcp1
MDKTNEEKPFNTLIIEDNPGDVRLMQEVLREGQVPCRLHVTGNGFDALNFLCNAGPYMEAPRPDLIFLDLNLPGKNGMQVLAEIKSTPALRQIPVVVLSTSAAQPDILAAYDLHANCYITKPIDFEEFMRVIRLIKEFWFTMAKLPREEATWTPME